MRKFVFGVAGSVAVGSLFFTTVAFGQLHSPPPGWTFTFAQSQPIGASTPVTDDNGLLRATVRSPLGSRLGRFLRIEMRDDGPVGIVTLFVPSRTVAIPLEYLRFNPAKREVVTERNWLEVSTMPSGPLDSQYARVTGTLTRVGAGQPR
jgi:hypothetical protein